MGSDRSPVAHRRTAIVRGNGERVLFARFHGKRDGSREAGDDARFLAKPVHGPVQVSITRQMLDPVHRKRHSDLVFPGNHILRQQMLRSESDEMAVPGYQGSSVASRGTSRRTCPPDRHTPPQAEPAAAPDRAPSRNPVAEAHRLRLVVRHIDRRSPDALLIA